MDHASGGCRCDDVDELPVLMSTGDLERLRAQLHRLVEHRCNEAGLPVPEVPPLTVPLPTAENQGWLPVAGMYGGFAYWDVGDGCSLMVESWSRVIQGSGQRHLVKVIGCELLADDIY